MKMSDLESFTIHDPQAEGETEEEEVIFKEHNPSVEISTPLNMISANDLDVVIEGWERKFEHLSQCLREIQLASEKASATMSNINPRHDAQRHGDERASSTSVARTRVHPDHGLPLRLSHG